MAIDDDLALFGKNEMLVEESVDITLDLYKVRLAEGKRADYVACYESKLTGRLANLAKLLVDDYFCGSEIRLSDLALFGSLFSYQQFNKELFDKIFIQFPTVAAWWGRLEAALATFLASDDFKAKMFMTFPEE